MHASPTTTNSTTSAASDRQTLGRTILLVMLGTSFLSVFWVMWQMDDNQMPLKPSIVWFAIGTLAILFPVMASHLHAIWLFKKISWLSWWFWIVNALLLGLMIYSRCRGDQNFYEEQVVGWFFSAYVGGTLGGLFVFGCVRKIAPRWLGDRKFGQPVSRRKLDLRTIFFWLTSIGILCGGIANRERLFLDTGTTWTVATWVLWAALYAGLFCLLVFFFVTGWLRTAKPFWLAALTLVVFSCLFPLGLGAYLTITWNEYDGDATLMMVAYTTLLKTASLLAVIWIRSCQHAQLIDYGDSPRVRAGRFAGLRRRIRIVTVPLGIGLKYVAFSATGLVFIYLIGWCVVHLLGGPERDPAYVNRAIVADLGGQDPSESWFDVVNRRCCEGVTKENNLAVKIIGVTKLDTPVGHRVQLTFFSDYPNETDPATLEYLERLGISLEEWESIPAINFNKWFFEAHQDYRQQIAEQFPDLDESLETESSRQRILAEFFFEQDFGMEMTDLTSAPWTQEDYPVGAEFVEAHQTQIAELRSLSKLTTFYSPLISDFEHGKWQPREFLLERTRKLLSLSAYYHLGNHEIDEAIEDCESLWRYSSLLISQQELMTYRDRSQSQDQANRLALAIAASETTTLNQMERLFEGYVNQPDILSRVDPDSQLLNSWFKHRIQQTVLRIRPLEQVPIGLSVRYPLTDVYQSVPSLVDWQTFNSVLDKRLLDHANINKMALEGRLTRDQLYRRQADIDSVSLPDGGGIPREDFYGVIGRQLIAFLQGPQAKGHILAESTSDHLFQLKDIFDSKTTRVLNEVAMALELYEHQNDHYPESLSQLAPEPLAVLKADPYSGKELVYQRSDEGYLLYSVGWNGVDDGGDPLHDKVFTRPFKDFLEYIQWKQANPAPQWYF